MAKVTLIFAVLLGALGLAGYIGTGSMHPTALIPLWFGLMLGLFGFLAITNENRRKLFMHISVTIAALGLIGAVVQALREYGSARSAGLAPDHIALASQLSMALILLVYVNLCVRSFMSARRARLDSE